MKLLIFDIDGTLVDSQHLICAAVHEAYDRHGLVRPARERILSMVGLSLPDTFRHLANGAGHPVESLVAAYRDAFTALRASSAMEPLYPGASEVIGRLARREDIALGIATGKSTQGVSIVLGHHGLLDRFVTIQTADTAPSKPDPGMVHNALRDTACMPQDAVVIGDSIYDMQMAKAAGAKAIGVAWGYHAPDDLHAAGADVVIGQFTALEPALDKLWALHA